MIFLFFFSFVQTMFDEIVCECVLFFTLNLFICHRFTKNMRQTSCVRVHNSVLGIHLARSFTWRTTSIWWYYANTNISTNGHWHFHLTFDKFTILQFTFAASNLNHKHVRNWNAFPFNWLRNPISLYLSQYALSTNTVHERNIKKIWK